jgi:5'(3')-deoxyribonucleotidase
MQKLRMGIDLDHVIRDINRQIVKYYQRDIDESIDLDEVDYKDDVISKVCHFKSKKEKDTFLYEDYPLEVFGHAGQVDRNLSRDLNLWMEKLTNQEEYDVDIFFYSMKEFNLTIQSSYFFLAKIGSRVRKVIFPKTIDELSEYGDVFITAYPENSKELQKKGKKVVFISTHFNEEGKKSADLNYESFREFLDDENKLNKIGNITGKCQTRNKVRSLWTLMLSCISSLLPTRKGQQTSN